MYHLHQIVFSMKKKLFWYFRKYRKIYDLVLTVVKILSSTTVFRLNFCWISFTFSFGKKGTKKYVRFFKIWSVLNFKKLIFNRKSKNISEKFSLENLQLFLKIKLLYYSPKFFWAKGLNVDLNNWTTAMAIIIIVTIFTGDNPWRAIFL